MLRRQHARIEFRWSVSQDADSRAALADIESELRSYGAIARFVFDEEDFLPRFPPNSPLIGPGLQAYLRSNKRTLL